MEKVVIKPSQFKSFKITVKGKPPGLIMNRFGAKAKQMLKNIHDKHTKQREVRDDKWIQQKCEDALHKYNGGFGIPSTAFKKAMIRMIKQRGEKMVDANTWFFVLGEYCPITKHTEWETRCDHVKLSNGSADLAYRPWFKEWEAELIFEYDESKISKESLLGLLEDAGRLGVLEWRPSSKTPGSFGTFGIKTGK